ncbi:hypothetical protein [Tardiphaga sp. 862_B3_N1_1]|uniref:hypothetical protein n=1 Tax=Tardiphaga sp. 862_B3_N1_1 TaxID=3240763 RepID=UPI003F88D8DB
MAKQPTASPEGESNLSTATAAPESKITLTEFCVRVSNKQNRPELLGGFEFVEKAAKRLKDTESAYQARFEAFERTPV